MAFDLIYGRLKSAPTPVKIDSDTGSGRYSRCVRLIGDSFLIYLTQEVEWGIERERFILFWIGVEDKV